VIKDAFKFRTAKSQSMAENVFSLMFLNNDAIIWEYTEKNTSVTDKLYKIWFWTKSVKS